MERHLYRQEIEELLAARWAPRNVNAFLARQHTDYVPVPERTLRRYRARRLASRVRQAARYEKLLEDDHVLLDTIRMKAGLILFQQQRLDRTIAMEDQLGGVVLEQVGRGMERLIRMTESYEQSLQLLGVLPRDPGTLAPGAINLTQQNFVVTVTRQVDEEVGRLIEQISEELRGPLGSALEKQRKRGQCCGKDEGKIEGRENKALGL